jgi:undecaprenyl phosphate-alpha-L-ara4FN deformylase
MTDLALRIDVDTGAGLRDGVPRMLDVLGRLGLRATFFVTFGPERTGLALGRAWRPGFAWKLLRTRALALHGWRAALRGTLLPAPAVGERCAPLLREVAAAGHEVGLHGYDHFAWQARVHRMRPEAVAAAFRAGVEAFARALGRRPGATAAPGWRTTAEALRVQEGFGFEYASDARGRSPFRVRAGEEVHGTLQIPTTLPTLDELLGRTRAPWETLEGALAPGLNVLTAHAELEGGPLAEGFEGFLARAAARGVRIRALGEVAADLGRRGAPVPACRVARGRVAGRSGWVLVQDGA